MSETSQISTPQLGVGEILICNKDTKGKFEPLKHFIGKVILAIGGGGDTVYVVEDKDGISSEVKSIQTRTAADLMKSAQFPNDQTQTMNSNLNDENNKNQKSITSDGKKPDDFFNENENEEEAPSQIIQICKGKYHLMKLTSDGKVRCSGKPYFGVVGLGGAAWSETTELLPNLRNVKVIQIACGEFHSLALAENGDLYTWGMGFEGQLGLSSQYKVASSPKYLRFFFRKPVKFITCGHNYSLAITQSCELYGWGENKLGQLGLGKIQIVDTPTRIDILDKYGEQEGCATSESLVNNKLGRVYTEKPLKACYVSAGYSHTCVVTEEGYPVTFGLNIYGQLGLGNTITSFEPRLIEKDEAGELIEKIVKCGCSTTGTFLIAKNGTMYSMGSGDIGHGDIGMVKLPKVIAGNRIYSHIFCNEESVVAFATLRILSVSPSCGPATGNTILSIIGSAFKDFPKLSVRFLFGGISRDVRGNFDKLSRTIFVHTPNFLEFCPNLELPCNCTIQVTFDGNFFTEYNEKFLIYPNTIKISAIEPKCGAIEGNSPLQVKINLDQIPQKYLFSLTIGFQAKPVNPDNFSSKRKSKKASVSITQNEMKSGDESKLIVDGQSTIQEGTIINPMDIENLDNQLDKANWYCVFSTYENGVMTCNIPTIENFSQDQVEYNVDIAINGQQFSGFPMIYRFYDIKIEKVYPNISSVEGGLQMKIYGNGLFDSVTKKGKITSSLGERFVEIQWDRQDKSFVLGSVPLNWITSDESILKSDNPSDLFNKYVFDIFFTLNGTQWINAGSFHYCDSKITRICYVLFNESDNEEARINILNKKEELNEDEKTVLGMMEPSQDKKKLADYEKKIKEEDDTIANVYKRPYNGLSLYGNFFPEIDTLKLRFAVINNPEINAEVEANVYYVNENKINCLIPEVPKLPAGEYELGIFLSLNGQQFVDTGKKILYIAPEFGMSFEDIVKADEADKKKKPGKK